MRGIAVDKDFRKKEGVKLLQEFFDLVEDKGLFQIGPGPFFLSPFPGSFAAVRRDDDYM